MSKHTKVYTCQYCGVEFCMLERPRHPKKFCSRQCQSNYLREHPSLPKKEHKFKNRHDFIDAVESVIRDKNRYVTMDEVAKYLHVATNEFARHGVDIKQVNRHCGHRKPVSVAQNIIYLFLKKYFRCVEMEASFKDLKSAKGMVLRYDISVEEVKLLIEIDGPMHNKLHTWYSEYRKSCDNLKDAYAHKNSYDLVRISVKNVHMLSDEYLEQKFDMFIKLSKKGNQQPELVGTPSNGSETDSVSRPEAAAAS